MRTLRSSPPRTPPDPWSTKHRLGLGVAVVVAFGGAWALMLRHRLEAWSGEHHRILDAVLAALLAGATYAALTAAHRARQARRSAARHADVARQLAEASEQFRSLFAYHPHGVFSVELDGTFGSANESAQLLSGYTEQELVERSFLDLLRPEDHARILGVFEALLRRETRQFEVGILHRLGHVVDLRLTCLPIVVGGEVAGLYGIAEDIGARNRMQADLRRANEVAERANQAKALFLANMSHEIRTPLTSVLASNELLSETDLDPLQARLSSAMSRAGRRLLRLVDDILDFSRIESGKAELEEVAFDVRALVDDTLALLSPDAEHRGLQLEARVEPSTPHELLGDPARLTQVLTNLVGNAVKFTETGWVRVTVDVADADGRAVDLVLVVADSGPGLTETQRERVFDSFDQGDASITRRYGGTGLGLAISRELVVLMGGTITVDSLPGEGCTFTVRLTLAVPPGSSPGPPAPGTLSP